MKVYKEIILVIIITLTSQTEGFCYDSQWQPMDLAIPSNTRSYPTMECADSLNCFIWGSIMGNWGYYFRRTTDGGNTWENMYLDSSIYRSQTDVTWIPAIRAISYPSTKLFIAVGDSGTIIRTTDKGMTWKKIILNKERKIFKLEMLDDKYGIALCSPYDPIRVEPYMTFDGGLNWIKMNFPQFIETSYIVDYQIINENLFYALIQPNGKQTYFLKVKGDWDEWTMDTLNHMFLHQFFINEEEGWLSGGESIDKTLNFTQMIHHTTDAGKHWDVQRDTNFNAGTIHDLKFANKNFGIAIGGFGCYMITTNGGRKWDVRLLYDPPANEVLDFRSLHVTSSKIAYMIEGIGIIYKYTRNLSGPQNHEPSAPSKPTGTNTDSVYLDYIYQTKTTDPEDDSVKYYFDWGDGKLSEWTKLYASGEQISVSHSWDTTGFFKVRVKARDKDEMESNWSEVLTVRVIGDVKPKNRPPDRPSKPQGSLVDSIYKSYDYIFTANDPDGDSLSYFVDWGDSTESVWSDFYPNNQNVTISHIWNKPGNYSISIKAKDLQEAVSSWSDSLLIEIVGKIISVEENTNTNEIEIYPNPTDAIVCIQSKNVVQQIKIMNISGEIIRTIPFNFSNQINLDLTELTSGFYQLLIETENSKQFKKIIKR